MLISFAHKKLSHICKMKYVFFTFLLSYTFPALSQTAYYDSLMQYQLKYKTDLSNDIKADTSKVSFYPFNSALNLVAKIEVLENQPIFNMTTSSGMAKEAQKFALVTFMIAGKEYKLYAYQLLKLKNDPEYSQHVFIPFTDKTSGKESYGGGRYFDFNIDDIRNGQLQLDFNKAYNPYCAFVTGYNCPIPPRENRVPLEIRAGEKSYEKDDY